MGSCHLLEALVLASRRSTPGAVLMTTRSCACRTVHARVMHVSRTDHGFLIYQVHIRTAKSTGIPGV